MLSVYLSPKVIPLSGAHCKRNKALNWTMIYQWDNSFTQPHAWIEPRTETNTYARTLVHPHNLEGNTSFITAKATHNLR